MPGPRWSVWGCNTRSRSSGPRGRQGRRSALTAGSLPLFQYIVPYNRAISTCDASTHCAEHCGACAAVCTTVRPTKRVDPSFDADTMPICTMPLNSMSCHQVYIVHGWQVRRKRQLVRDPQPATRTVMTKRVAL